MADRLGLSQSSYVFCSLHCLSNAAFTRRVSGIPVTYLVTALFTCNGADIPQFLGTHIPGPALRRLGLRVMRPGDKIQGLAVAQHMVNEGRAVPKPGAHFLPA